MFDVYLAGPFFNEAQKATMAQAKALLIEAGLTVCDPQELSPVIVDLPEAERKEELFKQIFKRNINGMKESAHLVACIDDRDTGTAFEVGWFLREIEAIGVGEIYTFSANGYGANVMLAQATSGHAADWSQFHLIIGAIKNGVPFSTKPVSKE